MGCGRPLCAKQTWQLTTASALCLQVSEQGVAVVAGAAVVANLFESFLGAALQGRAAWLSNDIVNAIQITVAAGLALVITAYLYMSRAIASPRPCILHCGFCNVQ